MSAAAKTEQDSEQRGAMSVANRERWGRATFTDSELIVVLAHLTQKAQPAKAPKDILDRVTTLAVRKGFTVSDAKEMLRKAATPAKASSPERKPAPGGKRPVERAAPAKKEPAPAKKKATAKVASTGKTKPEVILAAITGKDGATLAKLMELTGWQAHSVRGCVATLQTHGGNTIDSFKNEAGERTYRLAVPAGPKAETSKKAAAASRAKSAPRAVAKKKAAKKPARRAR